MKEKLKELYEALKETCDESTAKTSLMSVLYNLQEKKEMTYEEAFKTWQEITNEKGE